MSALAVPRVSTETLADVVERLGSIPLERIPAFPPPGQATEADVLARPDGNKHLYELVDGVLVEKTMGYYESLLAAVLIRLLGAFVEEHDLGIVLGADGTLRFAPGLVRIPDVSFIGWHHFPNRELPEEPIPDLVPDLAVEVLSKGNTKAEMDRKLREYFEMGVRLVWYVYPEARSVEAYTSLDTTVRLTEADTLEGGEVLPGFRLSIADWFRRAGRKRGV